MNDEKLRQIRELLANGPLSWTSVEIKSKLEIKTSAPIANPFTTNEIHYIETASGRRYYESHAITKNGVDNHIQYFSDGEKCADVMFGTTDGRESQKQVGISRVFGNERSGLQTTRPVPFNFLFLGKQSLDEALAKPCHVGASKHLGRLSLDVRLCDVSYGPGKVRQDITYSLDEKTGYPLRVVADAAGGNRRLWDWEALSLADFQGRTCVDRSRLTVFDPNGQALHVNDITLTQVIWNQTYPDAMFWPAINPGVLFIDEFSNEIKQIPGGSNAKIPQLSETQGIPAPAAAAVPQTFWTDYLTPVLVVVSLAVLVTAIVLRFRRGAD